MTQRTFERALALRRYRTEMALHGEPLDHLTDDELDAALHHREDRWRLASALFVASLKNLADSMQRTKYQLARFGELIETAFDEKSPGGTE